MRQLSVMLMVAGGLTVVGPQAQEDYPHAFPRAGAKNVLENDRLRMWVFTWERGKPIVRHVHDSDAIEVFLEGGVIASTTNEGKTIQHTVAWKSARFVPRGTVDTEVATSGSPRAVVIELK